jgi:hypothetical protein
VVSSTKDGDTTVTENYPPYPTKLIPEGGGAPSGGGEPYYPPTPAGSTTGGAEKPASSSTFNRQKFVKSYANMVARTWTDESYLELVRTNTAETLSGAGLDAPEGSVFRIIECKITGMGNVDQQVQAWVEGYRTGLFDLYLPIKPEDVEIPEGGDPSATGGSSCCCTPCCCCT